MGEMLWCVFVDPEMHWRTTTLVFFEPLTFSQGSNKHKKGLAFSDSFFVVFKKAQKNGRSCTCVKKLRKLRSIFERKIFRHFGK